MQPYMTSNEALMGKNIHTVETKNRKYKWI